MVASRWPLRFSPAAFMSFSTSAWVRYSLARASVLGRRLGGRPRGSTVPITAAGRARQLFDDLNEAYFNPASKLGRLIKMALGKKVMSPPSL
jgi:hypothetical protein